MQLVWIDGIIIHVQVHIICAFEYFHKIFKTEKNGKLFLILSTYSIKR